MSLRTLALSSQSSQSSTPAVKWRTIASVVQAIVSPKVPPITTVDCTNNDAAQLGRTVVGRIKPSRLSIHPPITTSAHQQSLIVLKRSIQAQFSRSFSTDKPKVTIGFNSIGSIKEPPRNNSNSSGGNNNSSGNNNNGGKMFQNASRIRQNYHEESEAGVNKQINLELYACYVYQQLASHFSREDVALPGFERFFRASSEEERQHAERLMKLQNQRGGRVVLLDISKPVKQQWSSGLEAMEAALELEKTVNQSLLDLHAIAVKHVDPQFAEYIEQHFLTEQVEAIKKLGDYVTNLKQVGPGLGEYLFDRETLSS